MDKNGKIGLAVGGLVCFCGICFGAFQMGQSNSTGDDGNLAENAIYAESDGETGSDVGSGSAGDIGADGDSATELGLSALEMRLEEFGGNLLMSNSGEMKIPVAGSRLVSKDNLTTEEYSSAYISLDSAKVLRVDETTQVEIRQEDKHYDVDLLSGTVFFNVSQSLGADESLDFHSNNVVTGVRGTSGIITYSKEDYQTVVSVLTGTVFLTTRGEFPTNYTVNAGEIAFCTTQSDGTVQVVIVSQEEKGSLYYSDTFIDKIQLDLNNEGNSHPLSEELRKPPVFTLSNEIQVLGDCRTMSYEQAEGFATVLRNWNGAPIDNVCFFDGGDGIPVMILGINTYYEASGIPNWEYRCYFYQWNGSTVVDVDPYGSGQFANADNFGSSECTLLEKNGAYTMRYSPWLRGYGGTILIPSYYFQFAQGQRVTTPFMIGMYGAGGYSHYEFDKYDYPVDTFNWELVGSLTNSADMMSYLRRISDSMGTVEVYCYQGVWQKMEWRETIAAAGEGVSIPWNDTALVLAELSSS